ncbi:MAG: hypothetical protein HOI19_00035 [Rhodospirillaceae bacterium]|nr:hypothetical protein [Rhodospirillaceae bacterium]
MNVTIDNPSGQDLKRLTDIVLENAENCEPNELIAAALSIIAREANTGDAVNAAYAKHLSIFYEQPTSNADVNFNRRFAEDIRSGAMDAGERAKLAHDILQAHARARLEISNPEYLDKA